MSKFNKNLSGNSNEALVENLAGGLSYKLSDINKIISILLTSFVNDQYYRSSNKLISEVKELVNNIEDKEFLAKLAIYARDKFGMRSISHVLASELANHISGREWAKRFYEKVVIRPDDMTEILAYYIRNKTNPDDPKFPNSMKKGFAKAFDKFDNYQIAKYKNSRKNVKLVDVVNLVHPIPNEKNKEALEKLVKNELKNTETWEAKLTEIGKISENEEQLKELKSEAWKELVLSRKIGYFALLRNLRNIILNAPDVIEKACEILKDEKLIKQSRVLPFRFATAYDEISKMEQSKEVRYVLKSINDALEISLSNVPKFEGDLLVAIDVSGSMSGRPSEIASLFTAVLAKSNNCDIIAFSDDSEYLSYDPSDSLMTIRNKFKFSMGGTNFKSIFKKASKKYDNIIILSDMQGWIGYYTPEKEFKEYKKRFNCDPDVFSWDLAGYGTSQFPESKVYCLYGFSDKVFDIIKLLKTDRQSLVNEIKSIQL